MLSLNNFESYNVNTKGNLFIVAPGLVNEYSFANKHSNYIEKRNIILLSRDVDDNVETFVDTCYKLSLQGYQVVVEYDYFSFDYIMKNKVKYVAIFPNHFIISIIKTMIENDTLQHSTYVKYYDDLESIHKICNKIAKNTNKHLQLMNSEFNIKAAIEEYLFMNEESYKYI